MKKEIDKFEKRKQAAEDKWLDGDISKEDYHELLERISSQLSNAQQTLADLQKQQQSNKPSLPDIAKLTSFDKLDRELLLILVKRIDVAENGKIKVVYNFRA